MKKNPSFDFKLDLVVKMNSGKEAESEGILFLFGKESKQGIIAKFMPKAREKLEILWYPFLSQWKGQLPNEEKALPETHRSAPFRRIFGTGETVTNSM